MGADSAKHPPSRQIASDKEKAAQVLVATLLKERASDAISTDGNGMMQWVPASSLEAQQGDVSQQEAGHEIREEFEEVLGKDLVSVFESDLESIKKELQPTFNAIPKNEYGELGHTAVRYALHRLFVARHGWYIRGIDPEGGHLNASSPAAVLKGLVPNNVQRLIEKMLYGRGFGLSEVAVLGAILENLIHQEAIKRTKTVFKMFDMALDKPMESTQVDFAIDHYMAAYIMGKDATKLTKKEMMDLYALMNEAYPTWEDTRAFTRKIRQDKYGNRDLTFKEIVAVLVQVGEKHGTWQQRECVDLKRQLIALEDQKDGCVPVSNFYSAMATKGKWQFSESPDYLRELGALDESDPKNLKVMIPNYLDGASNCVASSTYYSVCCINEGDAILGRIEKHFQAPDASPEELARLVAALPSSTVPAKRTLSTSLVQHLDEIAKVHDGRVPLHSRLFMQWMHNAYPHECPYPHVSGTKSPRLPETWAAEEHKDAMVSRAEVDGFIKQASVLSKHGQCGQWLNQEELYVPWQTHPAKADKERDAHVWAGASSIALLAALASMILMVIQVAKSLRAAAKPSQPKNMLTT